MPYRFQNEPSQNVRQMQYMNSRIQKVHIVQIDNLPFLLPRIKHKTFYSVAKKETKSKINHYFFFQILSHVYGTLSRFFCCGLALARIFLASRAICSIQHFPAIAAITRTVTQIIVTDPISIILLSLGFYLNLLYSKKVPKSIETLGLIYIILYFQILATVLLHLFL